MDSQYSETTTALREQIRAANQLHRRCLVDPGFCPIYERFIDVQLA